MSGEFDLVPRSSIPWGVNFGGGDNSRALLLFCHDRGLRPDWVLFADTGSERPHTYTLVRQTAEWCESVGFPFTTIRWIRKDGSFESVHDNCLRTGYLPSKAYGYAGCTFKWKIQPMQKWRKQNGFVPSTVSIGYDAGERRRIENAKKRACGQPEQGLHEYPWYPLVAWGIDRAACQDRLRKQGWESYKSSCFCCPNMKAPEWDELRSEYPELFQMCVSIQGKAEVMGNADSKSLFRSYDPSAPSCMCDADKGFCQAEFAFGGAE